MSLIVWSSFGDIWNANGKVSFNGVNKTINVNSDVTTLDIRSEVYSLWVDWLEFGTNSSFPLAMRYSGMDPIPNGESGGIFFLTNGWRLIIDFNKVAVFGVLYSDDYPTAYFTEELQPLYPAQVSGIVNNVIQTNTVTVAANPTEVAQAILASPVNTSSTPGSIGEFITKKLLTVAKFIGLR
jgi:hypothetical protein